MSKIELLLSFDHELSLGGARDYDRNLFAPTRALLDAAKRAGVPISLFTDVPCAIRFDEWGISEFAEPYRRQIGEALSGGHDVQLHIHPHWFSSHIANGRFAPSKDFRLADFADGPLQIESIVSRCHAYLTALCRKTRADYRCIAYRAGGFNLAPQTARILHALYAAGIRIDSSIIKGYRFGSDLSLVDFTDVPAQANWNIPLNGPVSAAASGAGLWEIPIASMPRTPLNNVPFLMNRVRHRNRVYDSGGVSIHDANTGITQKLLRLFPRSAWYLGFDDAAQSLHDLMAILRYHVRAHERDERITCAAIGHPKNMGNYAIDLFERFVDAARTRYGDRIAFVTYSDIAARMIEAGGEVAPGRLTTSA